MSKAANAQTGGGVRRGRNRGTGLAIVYRRWSTKAEPVLGAVARLSGADVEHGELPDTAACAGTRSR